MTTKDKIKETLLNEIKICQDQIEKLETIPGLDKLEPSAVGYFYMPNQIDFDHLTHDKIIEVIKAIGGKWDKTPSGVDGRIDYKTEVNGVTIRMFAGEPPPNCKIVEYLEEVPAQPARTVTKRKLQCL